MRSTEPVPVAAPPASNGTDGSSQWPMVSVIVPTRNRAASLADTLQGLMAQVYPRDRLEIIVVDNSSTDQTAEVIRAAQAASPFPLRYFRKENQGPAASRNHGIARATGEVIAFTDSDCHMGPDWVRNAVLRMGEGVDMVSGPVRPVVHPRRVPSFFSHQVDHSQPNPLYPTANMFYRREVFARLGGFDEQFRAYRWGPTVGGEDTEVAWRALRAGYTCVFAADAPVYHEASGMGMAAWLADPIRKRIMPRLIAQIPELRDRLLWRGLFLERSTAAFDLALTGALAAVVTRRRGPLALAAPWVWLMRGWVARDVWPPARWWRIPIKYALLVERFTVQAATLIVASLRHRTPVL